MSKSILLWGLLKFLHAFRERKGDQSREKGKPIKKFDGPRQKPSDADTIQRMLANLPAKRATRKMISLKDGFQRSIKNQKNSKTDKNKSLRKTKMQQIKKTINTTSHKNTNSVANPKKSLRLLRSNSSNMFENKMNMVLPKFKEDRKENSHTNSNVRRHSVRNISRVLGGKFMKNNTTQSKRKLADEQEKKKEAAKSNKKLANRVKSRKDAVISNKGQTEVGMLTKPKNTKKKNLEIKSSNELQVKNVEVKQTLKENDENNSILLESVSKKMTRTKKGLPTSQSMMKSDTANQKESSQNTAVVSSHQHTKKVKKREKLVKEEETSRKDILNQSNNKSKSISVKSNKILLNLHNDFHSESVVSDYPVKDAIIDKPLSNLKNSKKTKKKSKLPCDDNDISKSSKPETPKQIEPSYSETHKKKKYGSFSLNKSKVQKAHKNVSTNIRTSCRRKNKIINKVTSMINNLRTASKNTKQRHAKNKIMKIIQVDGSSQNKPSTRSKRLKKELRHLNFLCDPTIDSQKLEQNNFSRTSRDISPPSDLNHLYEVVSENISELNQDINSITSSPILTSSLLSSSCTEAVNSVYDTVQETTIDNIVDFNQPNAEKYADSEISNSSVIREKNTDLLNNKISTQDTENVMLSISSLSVTTPNAMKKKIKKQRGLNDCIAMLTNKLQDKCFTQSIIPTYENILMNMDNNGLSPAHMLNDDLLKNNENNSEKNVFHSQNIVQPSTENVCASDIELPQNKNKESTLSYPQCEMYALESETETQSDLIETPYKPHCLDASVSNEVDFSDESVYDCSHDIDDVSCCIPASFHQTDFSENQQTSKQILLQLEANTRPDKTVIESCNTAIENYDTDMDNHTKIQEITSESEPTFKSTLTPEITATKHTNSKTGVSQHFSQNCNIDNFSTNQTNVNESKFETERIKPKTKQKMKKKKQNSKSLSDKFRKSARRKEKSQQLETINDSRETFSESSSSITETSEKLVKKLLNDAKKVLSNTCEDYSNSGKENVIINERSKTSKHRKIKNYKDIVSRRHRKLHKKSTEFKLLEEQMKFSVPVNVMEIVKPSDEFIDSDDDVPLAEIAKKYMNVNATTKCNIEEDVLDFKSCKYTPSYLEEIEKDIDNATVEQEVIKTTNSYVVPETDCAAAVDPGVIHEPSEVQVNNEPAVAKVGESMKISIRRCKIIAKASLELSTNNVNRSYPKPTINNSKKREKVAKHKKKRSSRKTKGTERINLENNNGVAPILPDLLDCYQSYVESAAVEPLIEYAVQDKENHDVETKSAAKAGDPCLSLLFGNNVGRDVLYSDISTELPYTEDENQENSNQNYFVPFKEQINKEIANIVNNDTISKCKESENSIDTSSVSTTTDISYQISTNISENRNTVKSAMSEEEETVKTIEENKSTSIIELPVINSALSINGKPKSTSKANSRNNKSGTKKNSKSQNASNLSNAFCDICNKTFTRNENLLKHKRTLTHIAKLSELEALQAAEKSKAETAIEETLKETTVTEESVDISSKHSLDTDEALDSVDVSTFDEHQKNTTIPTTFGLTSASDSLKLVDIISDVLSKPVDDDFIQHNNFSDLILQSDHEIKRCKSLGERKSFESDKIQLFSNTSSSTHNIDLDQNFVVSKLSNTADIIVEKQISLLENMIVDNRINFKSSDRMFISSEIPANEEYSSQSNSSEFSILSSSKQEDCNDITFTHNTNIITNLIKPALEEDNLIQSARYEEISEDSSSSHFRFEEQKSRKALNRDEELFLECCSLLKSSSDVSDLCKKPTKSAKFLNNFGLKPLDELEWLEQKQIPTKKNNDFEYTSNNFISDDSHINASVSDNFYNDLSYSNSNMSNCNLSLKALLDRHENDNLFSQPPIFEDISTESEGSSGKSLENCFKNFKTISSTGALNGQDTVHNRFKINNCISPSVESAQIPEVHEQANEVYNAEEEKIVVEEETPSTAVKDKLNADLPSTQEIKVPVPKTIQAHITDYTTTKKKKNQNIKLLTKGAMKVFEGLKVSIPKEGLDMKEVLSCSPTSKRLQLESEEGNISVDKKAHTEKTVKHSSKLNKILNNGAGIKKIGNKLGLKIKKKFLPNHKNLFKVHADNLTESEKKSHDVYDFEETQDNIDIFTNNSNSLPNYRTFRSKITDKSIMIPSTPPIEGTSNLESDSNEEITSKSNFESDFISNESINDEDESSPDLLSELVPSSKKISVCKSITKKKCMIMGRIFKNALKSKIADEIKNIPMIENAKIVENYVLNCQEIQSENENVNKEHKLSEEEMNVLFDNLLNEEKPKSSANRKKDKSDDFIEDEQNSLVTSLSTRSSDYKHKQKLLRCKKRPRANSSDSSDEEFSIKKNLRRNGSKKSSSNTECVINLEQELKECIGVASRKSQRKCTSGKQNVLVEYWSSDESNFGSDLDSVSIKNLENVELGVTEKVVVVSTSQNIEECFGNNVVADNEKLKPEPTPLVHATPTCTSVSSNSNVKKKKREMSNRRPRRPISSHIIEKIEQKSDKNLETCTSVSEDNNSQTIASSRQKRTAVDTLYYWSSSSEDELQDIIEIKPLREEYDEEDRPLQHGWIVGDSPKKLVTMLAHAKGKKLDGECVKKNKNKRTSV